MNSLTLSAMIAAAWPLRFRLEFPVQLLEQFDSPVEGSVVPFLVPIYSWKSTRFLEDLDNFNKVPEVWLTALLFSECLTTLLLNATSLHYRFQKLDAAQFARGSTVNQLFGT